MEWRVVALQREGWAELVKYHIKLTVNPEEKVTKSDLSMFRDHGMLSVKILEKFDKYYKKGLFTPQDFLKLLVSRSAIIKIKDNEYLMPALLPHCNVVELSKDLQSSASLMTITLAQGYIPSGLFCCLVIQLLSFGWKVCMNSLEMPLCLYRNCVEMKQQDTHKITLVDMVSYIEVKVHEPSKKLFLEIRGLIRNGIKKACNVLQHQNIKHEISSDQLMFPVDSNNELADSKLAITSMPTTKLLIQLLTIPSQTGGTRKRTQDINIIQRTSNSCTMLGMYLLDDDNCHMVDDFKKMYGNDQVEIVTAVYKKWISGTGRKPVTWQALVDVLKDIKLNTLAEEIESHLKPSFSSWIYPWI